MRSPLFPRSFLAVLCAVWATTAYAIDMPPDEGDDETEQSAAPAPATEPAKPAKPAAEPAPPPASDENVRNEYDTVILQGLNKVTGRISKFNAIVNKPVSFGNLEIIAHRCWQASPEDRPENAALLEIHEVKAGEQPATLFTGWMFSSSPGLSALEHPVYDITVLSCAAQPSSKPKPTPTPTPTPAPAKKSGKSKGATKVLVPKPER